MKNLLYARSQDGKFFRWSFTDEQGARHAHQINLELLWSAYLYLPHPETEYAKSALGRSVHIAQAGTASVVMVSTNGFQEQIEQLDGKTAKMIMALLATDSAVIQSEI